MPANNLLQEGGVDLSKALTSARVYQGANSQHQLKIPIGSSGFFVRDTATGLRRELGAVVTMALALTECCAEFGHGKFFFYLTRDSTPTASAGVRDVPKEVWNLPHLLYIDFKWDDYSREEWFRSKHDQRTDMLSSRSGALPLGTPVIPIILCCERDAYPTVALFEGYGSVIMSFNGAGHMHIGFVDEITAGLPYYDAVPNRLKTRWLADEAKLSEYRISDGHHAAQTLQQMFQRQWPGSIVLYRTIMEDGIKAHKLWVDAGAYTVRGDPTLGPTIANTLDTLKTKGEPAQPTHGQRLQAIYDRITDWPQSQLMIVEQYRAHFTTASMADFARFLAQDEGWSTLSKTQKDLVIDLCELEEEEFQRGQVVTDHNGAEKAQEA